MARGAWVPKKKKQNSKPISSQCGWLYEMCKYFTQAPNHL